MIFVNKANPKGKIFVNEGIVLKSLENINSKTYGLGKGEYKAENIEIGKAKFIFDVNYINQNNKENTISGLSLSMPGYHNVANATAAIAVALELGIHGNLIKKAIQRYHGVKRRFEFVVNNENHIYIDDYAHHPTEIEVFIKSLKALYPEKKINCSFSASFI